MRKTYDFAQSENSPFAGRLKKQVTIRPEEGTVAYLKDLTDELGIPYQTLNNLYLRDCASSGWRLNIALKPGNQGACASNPRLRQTKSPGAVRARTRPATDAFAVEAGVMWR